MAADRRCRIVMEEKTERTCNRGQPGRQVARALAALRQQVEAAQAVELARALEQLEHLDEHDRAVVQQFGQRMVDQMFLRLGRRMQQVFEQEQIGAGRKLLIQLLAGAEPSPAQPKRKTLQR